MPINMLRAKTLLTVLQSRRAYDFSVLLIRCGDGVIKLYQSSEVEDFLTGTPSTCDKAIYCHGALCKVITVFFNTVLVHYANALQP